MTYDVAEIETRTRALLASDRVTPATREALAARLQPLVKARGVLDARQAATLAAVAADLVPLGPLAPRVKLGRRFDAELAAGPGDGWRYADMPADADAVRAGLDALDAASRPSSFGDLAVAARHALLEQARTGRLEGAPPRWFEEVLAGLTRLAYAHPLVQVAVGYDGMADAHGFQDLHAPAR